MTKIPVSAASLWSKLRASTPARIGLARAGSTIATAEHLAFQLAHAQARDAVYETLDIASMRKALSGGTLDSLAVKSAAQNRHDYLSRPDQGRRLEGKAEAALRHVRKGFDLLFVVADGLSAGAVTRHAVPVLRAAIPIFQDASWRVGPIVLVEQGRVAIGDEIGQLLESAIVAVLIGERPGLSSPYSLGIYVTWNPKPGRVDAERNCLSNIRPEGMPYTEAAQRLFYLCHEGRRRQLTGVQLKDQTFATGAAFQPEDKTT